jgi:hypothetical protein
MGPVLRPVVVSTATAWLETDPPGEVEVLGPREHPWTVAGHHYALVSIAGLAPGTSTAIPAAHLAPAAGSVSTASFKSPLVAR